MIFIFVWLSAKFTLFSDKQTICAIHAKFVHTRVWIVGGTPLRLANAAKREHKPERASKRPGAGMPAGKASLGGLGLSASQVGLNHP